jgi:NodT family efflux transporter outer membrane factor (OMF) lipoprotein
MRISIIATIIALTTVSVLAGAQSAPPITKDISPAYKEAQWLPAQVPELASGGNWWNVYHDARLNELEQNLATSNLELKAAESRFQQARSLIAMNRATEAPIASVAPSIDNMRYSANRPYFSQLMVNGGTGAFTLPFDLSYEVDLWGRIHKMVASARDQAQASAADLANIRLILEAELAFDYFDLRSADAEAKILKEVVADRAQIAVIEQDLFDGGVVSQDDLSAAKENLHASRVRLEEISIRRAQDEHAIAVLGGKEPAQFTLPADAGLQDQTPEFSVGVPSVLLERRPDIAAQQRLVAAANEQIGIARTAYYPSFTLSAEAGLQGTSLWNWMNWPSRFWAIGGQLSQTLFDGSRRKANTALAQQQYDGAVANYRQTVLRAFQEVEDQLSTLQTLNAETRQQSAAAQEAEQRLSLISARYAGGISTQQSVLSSHLQVYSDQLALVDLDRRSLQASVSLIKATGGGWSNVQLAAIR